MDDGRTSNMSDFSKTINSQLDKQSRTPKRQAKKERRERRQGSHKDKGGKYATHGPVTGQYADAVAAQELTDDGFGSMPRPDQMGPDGSVDGGATQTTLPVLEHHNITMNRHARGQSDQGFVRSDGQDMMAEAQYFKEADQRADMVGHEADSI